MPKLARDQQCVEDPCGPRCVTGVREGVEVCLDKNFGINEGHRSTASRCPDWQAGTEWVIWDGLTSQTLSSNPNETKWR